MWKRKLHSLVELAGKDCTKSRTAANADALRKSELATKGKWVALPPVPSVSKNSLSHMVLQKPNNVTAINWLKQCCPQISPNDAETLFRTNQVKLCSQASSEIESQEPGLEKVTRKQVLEEGSILFLPKHLLQLINTHHQGRRLNQVSGSSEST